MSMHGQTGEERKGTAFGLRFAGITVIGLGGVYTLLKYCQEPLMGIIKACMRIIGNSEGMSVMVFLVILLGTVMCISSLHRMRGEREVLVDRYDQNLKGGDDEGVHKCYSRLKENKKTETLLYRRLDVLLSALTVVHASKEKKLPAMSDLHEITLQRELSRWDSAGMNTIISFLLILGILGTLTGVHDVLHADEYGLQLERLAPALSPSAFAVLGTVWLMILRAWYLMRVDSYLGQLDEVTMKCILPLLTQTDQTGDGGKWKELTENLKGMEALDVPEFREDADAEKRWSSVREARVSAEAQVLRLAKSTIPSTPDAPLPPIPPSTYLQPILVREQLADARIKQGSRLCASDYHKFENI